MSWEPVDLADLMRDLAAGAIARPEPTYGADGVNIFYTGRLNAVFGRWASAKSFIVLHVAVSEISAGAVVWWIDLEDDALGVAERLVDLGADPEYVERYFRFVHPTDPLDTDSRASLLERLEADQPALIVVDSAGEWMSLESVNPNYDNEVAAFYRTCVGPFTRSGAAVVAIDHVPHEASDKLRAIGSQRKLAAVSGAAYLVEPLVEFGRDRIGRARLKSAKDRLGTYPRGTIAAEFTLDATTKPYTVQLAEPETRADEDEMPPARRKLLEAVQALETPSTRNQLVDWIAENHGHGLRRPTVSTELNNLHRAGLVDKLESAGQATLWFPPENLSGVTADTPLTGNRGVSSVSAPPIGADDTLTPDTTREPTPEDIAP